MQPFPRLLYSGISTLFAALLLVGSASAYNKGDDQTTLPTGSSSADTGYRSSRSFAIDNDLLVPGARDQDYTYGFNINFAGQGVDDHWASMHSPLEWLDSKLGVNPASGNVIGSSRIEYGLFGFTPEDITVSEPLQGDRPYAGLVYVASTRENYRPAEELSWQSTLSVGILGLDIVGDLQKGIHSITGSDEPKGWDNQISKGGEPTARYSLAQLQLVYRSESGLELKTTTLGSVGYITEASWSLSLRAGDIHTPWVSFNPELTSYGEKSNSNQHGKVSEHFFWTGLSLKARLYNVFLQGQFKDSELT